MEADIINLEKTEEQKGPTTEELQQALAADKAKREAAFLDELRVLLAKYKVTIEPSVTIIGASIRSEMRVLAT